METAFRIPASDASEMLASINQLKQELAIQQRRIFRLEMEKKTSDKQINVDDTNDATTRQQRSPSPQAMQIGPLLTGPGGAGEQKRFTIPKLSSSQEDRVKKAKKYAMEESIKSVLLKQTLAHQQQNESDVRLARSQISLTKVPQKRYHCPGPNCCYNGRDKYFKTFSKLQQHYMRIHGQKNHCCMRCGLKYGLLSDLKRHMTKANCQQKAGHSQNSVLLGGKTYSVLGILAREEAVGSQEKRSEGASEPLKTTEHCGFSAVRAESCKGKPGVLAADVRSSEYHQNRERGLFLRRVAAVAQSLADRYQSTNCSTDGKPLTNKNAKPGPQKSRIPRAEVP